MIMQNPSKNNFFSVDLWFCLQFTLYNILTILAFHWLFLGVFLWNVVENIF
jgi:hypothetical protein